MGNTEIWLAQIRLNRPRIRITEEPLYCTFHWCHWWDTDYPHRRFLYWHAWGWPKYRPKHV